MADIKQAAEWMKEGHKIHRPGISGTKQTIDPENRRTHPCFASSVAVDDKGILRNETGLPIVMTVGSLLAEDWEIVP